MHGIVLIIEDDDDVRDALCEAVEVIGRRVATACDGMDALAVLRTLSPPCLILLDLVMPRMDGWRFLATLRRDHALARVPVVVVSAHAGTHTPEGANGLLRKPMDLSQLRDAVLAYCPG